MINFLNYIFNKVSIKSSIGNNINIHKNAKLKKFSKIKINGKNNKIFIEEGKYNNLIINIEGDNHFLHIKKTKNINGLSIIIKNNSNSLIIGENFSCFKNLFVSCGKNNTIDIGNNCLFSSNIEIWNCDGHSILQNDKIINLSQPIFIEENVWIGGNSKILKGAFIKKGCVIGANSLVTSKVYEENSLIVGSPAKVIKNNISWSFENLEC